METDAKNRTSTNSASKLTNPLEVLRKTFRLLNHSILGLDEQEADAKNRNSRNSASEITNPLGNVKKTCQALESLNYDVRARS